MDTTNALELVPCRTIRYKQHWYQGNLRTCGQSCFQTRSVFTFVCTRAAMWSLESPYFHLYLPQTHLTNGYRVRTLLWRQVRWQCASIVPCSFHVLNISRFRPMWTIICIIQGTDQADTDHRSISHPRYGHRTGFHSFLCRPNSRRLRYFSPSRRVLRHPSRIQYRGSHSLVLGHCE